jgi:4-aminobutyrate aminotransferase-like enzyme
MSLLDRTRAVLPSWLAIYYEDPIEIERGEGRRVWDSHGNAYLDFFGGILTTMTAHALPEVTKAVSEQAGRIIHSSTLYLNRPMVELAEQIATVSAIPDAKVFLTTSGTEANDTALLLASSLRRSNQILALRNSYHGRSFSTIAITGNRSWSPTSLSPFQTYYVHGGQQYRSPFAGLPTASSSPRASPTCARCSTRWAATSRRSSPSPSRASAASPPARTGCSARSRKCCARRGSCGSPTRCRPAGAAPASTSGAGRPTGAPPIW